MTTAEAMALAAASKATVTLVPVPELASHPITGTLFFTEQSDRGLFAFAPVGGRRRLAYVHHLDYTEVIPE